MYFEVYICKDPCIESVIGSKSKPELFWAHSGGRETLLTFWTSEWYSALSNQGLGKPSLDQSAIEVFLETLLVGKHCPSW